MAASGEASFAGASAIIFGGGKGIGRAVALEWARRGASVPVANPDAFTRGKIAGFASGDLGMPKMP